MKNLENWLAKKSGLFSLLAGEDFTNGEVVLAHIGITLMLLACGLAECMAR